MKRTLIALLALAFTAALVRPALAEDPVPAGQQEQKQEAKTLRTEIVKLKYVRAQDVQNLLYAFSSREGRIDFNPNLPGVLTVRDTPDNVEKMLAAIHELDVKPADVLYTVQLVLGSETEAATDPELKNDLVIKELGKLLRYKGYTLLDSTIVRTVNRDRAEVKFGPKADFTLYLRPDVAGDAKAAVIKTDVQLKQMQVKTEANTIKTDNATLIESTLNIKSGDRTVVGVSKLDGGDKGLILIISAKIVD